MFPHSKLEVEFVSAEMLIYTRVDHRNATKLFWQDSKSDIIAFVMASKSSLALFFAFIFVMLSSSGFNLAVAASRQVNMVLYLQETLSGVDATIETVGGVNGTSSGLLSYGTVNVINHLVTQGPHPSSTVLGRMQGVEARPDPVNSGFHMLSSILFQTGKYNGSSLEIQGTNRFNLPQRELSVVGGTGRFRYARGYALLDFLVQSGQTLSFKFNVTIS
ncbi:hypothetical protein KI387_017972, partial [Taxus chinensis]